MGDSDDIRRLEAWQQEAMEWLPECGTACQCQGEHDCPLKRLRRQARARQHGGPRNNSFIYG